MGGKIHVESFKISKAKGKGVRVSPGEPRLVSVCPSDITGGLGWRLRALKRPTRLVMTALAAKPQGIGTGTVDSTCGEADHGTPRQ
jgi:hypothetical protein